MPAYGILLSSKSANLKMKIKSTFDAMHFMWKISSIYPSKKSWNDNPALPMTTALADAAFFLRKDMKSVLGLLSHFQLWHVIHTRSLLFWKLALQISIIFPVWRTPDGGNDQVIGDYNLSFFVEGVSGTKCRLDFIPFLYKRERSIVVPSCSIFLIYFD